jgi:hypothetical protein
MSTETNHWIILGILNIPVYLGLGRLMFDDWSGFFESIRFSLTPDFISMFRGEWEQDLWESLKLFIFVGLCIVVVIGEQNFFF